LVKLIDIALANNPATRQAWENARAREMEIKQAESEWYPQVTAAGDFTKEKKVAHPKDDNLNVRNYGMQAEATYMLLDFGGRDAGVEEATQLILAANFEFNQALQDLMLDTEKGYYGLYSAQSSLEAARMDADDAEAALIAARRRFQVGLVSKLDALQAESNYDDSLYSLEEAKGNLKSAEGTLAEILGFSSDTKFEIAVPSGEMPAGITEEDVSQLIEEGLQRRPDIAASRANLRAKEAAVKAANSDLWPTLNLGGSAEKRWYEYFGESKANKDHYDYIGYLNVKWDIFDGFYNLARRNAARRDAAAEREKLKQAELEASRDIWTKYYNFKTAARKLVFSEAFLDAAQASHKLAADGYSTGLKSILDLLKAQSQLSDARSKLIESRKDLFVSLAELIHATGSLHAKGSSTGVDQ